MNLVIFTPINNQSATAKMALLVSDELLNLRHEIIIVRTEDAPFIDIPIHYFNAPVLAWNDPEILPVIRAADLLIYHIGDDFQFHRGSLEWLPQFPGIVCLHDSFLGSLFYDWAAHHEEKARHIINIWYGNELADHFFSSAQESAEEFTREMQNKAPMTEWVAAMANGVITHSSQAIEHILQACPGPVYVVPMPHLHPNETAPPVSNKSIKTIHINHYVQGLFDMCLSTLKVAPLLQPARYFSKLLLQWNGGSHEGLENIPNLTEALRIFEKV